MHAVHAIRWHCLQPGYDLSSQAKQSQPKEYTPPTITALAASQARIPESRITAKLRPTRRFAGTAAPMALYTTLAHRARQEHPATIALRCQAVSPKLVLTPINAVPDVPGGTKPPSQNSITLQAETKTP